ncbi:nucleotide pyrophosphohydrolase [Ktedonosporobacter rubrisoli]|uniref:Nucleotide pyrophosphohydrolase n=1 Tax=Ktedonosporobacter rubrisoli TaxID=2509675 RepID=A0A4V0YZD3_KTERU|nr:nucleoside triphosphate pyrophosphohydrolase [Ktedonosporobacter rubrisoli]QBD79321.1 nucleotide pyrophosphohydrolase [Ktedonosporobacter rubrisoli]
MLLEYHNKLVRDNIPKIIQEDNCTCTIEIMDEPEFRQALRQKLVEEAQEAAQAEGQHLISELADIYEVIDALMSSYKIDPELVRREQEHRRSQRGGFIQRIRLLNVSRNYQ